MVPIDDPTWLRVSDAAKFLHIKQNKTIYKWIQIGKIPAAYVRKMPNGWLMIHVDGLVFPVKPKSRKRYVRPKTNAPPKVKKLSF